MTQIGGKSCSHALGELISLPSGGAFDVIVHMNMPGLRPWTR